MKVNSKNEIEKLSKKLSVKENEAEKLNKKVSLYLFGKRILKLRTTIFIHCIRFKLKKS
jgi:hypothetical protein